MREEEKSGRNLEEEYEKISLKHFIYLDKNKLHSYSSQLLGGIIQSKRLTENEGARITQSSDEESLETTQENGKEGEISIGPKNYAGGMSGKSINKTISKNILKKGANVKSDESLSSYTEDIVEHDYGYLKLEEILKERGILKEIESIENLEKYSSLVKIKGICRFSDLQSLIELFQNENVIKIYLNNAENEQNISMAFNKGFKQDNQHKKKENQQKVNEFKTMLEVIKAFSIGSFTVNAKVGNSNLVGSIDLEHLRITRDQLRSAYIMPGDVEMTIVGFIPRRKVEAMTFPGLAGSIDMTDVWKAWTGEIDAVIEPIAIYTEIT